MNNIERFEHWWKQEGQFLRLERCALALESWKQAAPTQGADARPVADAREALTDTAVEQWLDRQGNDSGQGLCDMYTSAVRDGYRLARSTLTDFYATRDAAPSDSMLPLLVRLAALKRYRNKLKSTGEPSGNYATLSVPITLLEDIDAAIESQRSGDGS